MAKPTKSPSNTYVAMCNKTNFDGFYFRKFTLPQRCVEEGVSPSWYFLNILNPVACLEKMLTFEDFTNVKEEGEEDNLFWRAVNLGKTLTEDKAYGYDEGFTNVTEEETEVGLFQSAVNLIATLDEKVSD